MGRERPRLGATEVAPSLSAGSLTPHVSVSLSGRAPVERVSDLAQDQFDKWAGFSRRACPELHPQCGAVLPANSLQCWS